MMDLDSRIGPASIRAWGLFLNFGANALLLYGAVGYIEDGSRLFALLLGGAVTLVAIAALSSPNR